MSTIATVDGEKAPSSERGCPLCGKPEQMPKAKMLYGHAVCRKCYYAFANRRQLAFAIDVVLWLLILLVASTALGVSLGGMESVSLLGVGLFYMKDGLFGHSPGKALFGLRTIHDVSGKSIGLGRSFLRNLPLLIPLIPLVAAVQLCKGYRIGDRWVASKVVWMRYSSHPIFMPKSDPRYEWTVAEIEEKAYGALSRATKLEVKGRIEEALRSYEAVIASFPQAEAARDARVCMESLRKQLQG